MPNTQWGYYGSMERVIKKKALRRLQIVTGQIKGLEKMIADEKYCIDVITQSSAIIVSYLNATLCFL